MFSVTVNGVAIRAEAGTRILQLLNREGIHVPQLCEDPRLAPVGACRLCLVEVEGAPRPLAACTTPLVEGMSIRTHSAPLIEERKTLLRLLATSYTAHPLQAQNAFLEELRAHGLEGALGTSPPPPPDASHPYLQVDMSKCIYCYRCERICNDVQGQFTWRVWNRGADTRIRPDSGTTLAESSCVGCGACADSCPSGAIVDKTLLSLGAPTRWTRTTCPYCGVGCEMQVGSREGRLVQIRPVLDAPVNKGHLCVKGRYAFGFNQAPDRATSPMIRRGGHWQVVSWKEVLAFLADRLRELGARHGPDALAVLGSARATNEENYLTQKFARVALGTNNVDCCARVCHAPSAAALGAMLGAGAATNSFDDIERANTLLLVGTNATENHPIVGARIRQAARRGARLVVVDPRRTELAQLAEVHLQLRAGTTIPLLHAMAWTILHEGRVDEAFLHSQVEGVNEFFAFISIWTPERAEAVCGVPAERIRHAARLYASSRPSMSFHGLGITEHVQGTQTVMALINLALLTGNLGRPGTGINPLRGQNNVQGAAHMGCEPHHLTGYLSLEEGRPLFVKVWQAPVPRARGLDLMEMMEAAAAGRLKALYAIGYDVLLTNPQASATRAALSKLELVIVQDLFLSHTAREVATVFLPAASAFEKEGTFMNSERRVQRVRQVLPPPGEARADWEILCALGAGLGAPGFDYQSPQQIWDEVRSLWKGGAGLSYPRLEAGGLQWPCPTEEHPGTPVLHTQGLMRGSRALLQRIEYQPTAEQVSDEYPLRLMTGRKLYQFNAGTMTGRTHNSMLQPSDRLDISPGDAQRLGLNQGEVVVVRSRYGAARLAVNVDQALQSGEVFATFHTSTAWVNQLTGPHLDSATHTPEFKVTAVRVERP